MWQAEADTEVTLSASSTTAVGQKALFHGTVPQESTANSNLGRGTIIIGGTIAGIRNFRSRYFYYQRYYYLRLESILNLAPKLCLPITSSILSCPRD